MANDDMDHLRQAIGQSLMQVTDLLGPVLDSAEGIKVDMVGRGWNPQNAESVAVAYVQVALQKVMGAML